MRCVRIDRVWGTNKGSVALALSLWWTGSGCAESSSSEPHTSPPARSASGVHVVSAEPSSPSPATDATEQRSEAIAASAQPNPATPTGSELGAPAQATSKPASVSLGYPNDGTLEHPAELPRETPSLRFNPNRSSVARYATDQVIAAIARAAEVVRRELPGGRLTVNDLSLVAGGPIEHHGSHRNGRDADILFYLLDDAERPIESVGAPIDPEGYGHDYKDLSIAEDDVRVHLDAPRTWRFVQALLEDPVAKVQRIFVVEHVRSMLLAEAERQDASIATRERFGHMACQPGFPHDDHMHVRWFCDPADIALGCTEMQPIYPWHRDWLSERNLEPVLADRSRKPPPSKKFSHQEARQSAERKAGSIHPKVQAFLERRKAWLPAPHPGRPWCK